MSGGRGCGILPIAHLAAGQECNTQLIQYITAPKTTAARWDGNKGGKSVS